LFYFEENKLKRKNMIWASFPLSLLGDLNLSLLLTASVLYGYILGAGELEIGFIGGAYGLSYTISASLLGRLGDKIPRKFSLLLASIGQISIILYILFIASSVFEIILSQFFIGVFYGFFWPTIEAFISENTDHSEEIHQKAISNFCISWSFGYTFGPFIAGIFYDIEIFIPFIILLVSYCIMLLIICFGIPKINQNGRKNNDDSISSKNLDKTDQTKSDIDRLKNKIDFRFLIMIVANVFIYATISKILLSFFTNFALNIGWDGFSVGFVLFFFGIGRTSYFLFARFFQKKFKSSVNKVNFSILIIGFMLLLTAFIPFIVPVAFFFLTIGFTQGLVYMSSLEMLMQKEKESKGAVAGLFESAVGIGSAFSPILAGLLAEIDMMLPFFVFAGITFFIYFFNLFLARRLKQHNNMDKS
jgi:MFS family permease